MLRAAGIPFRVLEYEHREKGAVFAANALGVPLERFAKTLVVSVDGAPTFALLPGDGELSLKKLAAAAGGRAASLTTAADAERLTGYLTGGISPLGSRRTLPVYVEEYLTLHDRILVNAGQRGVIVEVGTIDLVRLLEATPADIAAIA